MAIPPTKKKTDQQADGLSENLSDEALVVLFRQTGNREVIGVLFRRYSHLVLGVCYKYLGNREDAQDAAMGVFESLFTSLCKYEVHHFKPWLFTITRSQCLQILRGRKKEGSYIIREENLLADVMENGGIVHHNNAEETEEQIRKLNLAVKTLSPGQQHCILLFYFDDKSYQEIAASSGFSVREVKSHLQNGKRNLKKSLEQSFY